jgi:3-methyladenine DNA glycosylase AlkD
MNILDKIDLELKGLAKDPKNIKDHSIFHKDGKKRVNIATPLVRKLAAENFKEIKNLKKEQIFSLCEKLLKTKRSEHRHIAFDWAYRVRKQYQKEDFKIFESWVKKYVNDWGSCDDLCTHAFGEFVFQFPKFLPEIKQWARSPNKWFRRASAVILIYSLWRGEYVKKVRELNKQALDTAKILLQDAEDLVQKGYGWMLKEASKFNKKEIFDFVIKNKKTMPRTALRYAIEKLPQKMKDLAMKKK